MTRINNTKNYILLIYHIIKKDLKLLIRSKSSALIILLGPIFIILLVSMAFNTSGLYDIKIGVFSESYTSAADSLIDKLKDKEFKVMKIDSANLCLEEVKKGNVHVCIVIPPDLEITKDIQNEISIHVDYSRINLAWMILDTVSSKVSEQSSMWSLNLTINVLNKLEETRDGLISKRILVTTSLNNSEDIAVKTFDILNKIEGVDTEFEINDSRFYDLKGEIEELVSIKNASDNETDGLANELSRLEMDLLDVDNQLANISSDLSELAEDVHDVRNIALANRNNLKDYDEAINVITLNIESVDVKNASSIVDPVVTSIKPVSSSKTNFDYIASTLIILVIMFIAVLLASTTVVAEKTSKAYFRRYISSTKDIIFILATYLTVFFIMCIQLVIMLSIASVFLHTSFLIYDFFTLLFILFVLTTLFILAGMLIGYLFNSEETSLLAAISFSSILLFFSNTLLPLENMPVTIKNIALLNPFVIGQQALNRLLLFQGAIDKGFYLLIFYIIVLFAAIVFIQRMIRTRLNK